MSAESGSGEASTPASPELTKEQEKAIHLAVCGSVVAAVTNQPLGQVDTDLEGASSKQLMGCFVTLKRQGQLRGCCGSLSQPYSLFQTLCEVAVRTATRDVRLPPISPTELEFLDVSVSLLYGFRPLTSIGTARIDDIVVGQHGLRIQSGSQAGLLLPEVAVENRWDSLTFLRQVCRKAGLPDNAWESEKSRVMTFHTYAIKKPFSKSLLEPHVEAPSLVGRSEELESLIQLFRNNLMALLEGATPSYYAPDCVDGTVQGLAVHWHDPLLGPTSVGSMSLRPGVPLQSTLFNLCESSAQLISAGNRTTHEVARWQMGISLLNDPAVHGTVAQHDLRGFDAKSRMCMVMESSKSAWVYDQEKTFQELLEEAATRAQVSDPQTAQVISMGIRSTEKIASVSTVPAARVGEIVRPAGVAGRFYPADEVELTQMISGLLAEHSTTMLSYPAIMVPHAGLRYSGSIAAAVFARTHIPKQAIVLGPKHTRLGVDWAVTPNERWAIGNAELEADPKLARDLSAAIPGLELDSAAHAREHSIEVELPFFTHLSPKTKVVGIALGSGNLERCQVFSDGLAKLLESLHPRPLLVISSDMNHFATDDENRRLDDIALQAMETADPAHLYRTVTGERISMCGVLPAVIVMMTLQKLGCLNQVQRVAYGTSADAGGDKERVVGYAGVVIS